jgi:hypothetical protein
MVTTALERVNKLQHMEMRTHTQDDRVSETKSEYGDYAVMIVVFLTLSL